MLKQHCRTICKAKPPGGRKHESATKAHSFAGGDLGVSRTLQRWGSPTDVNSQGETVFGVCLRVTCSRNPLASRQLISPDIARQHSSVIRPSAGQMIWQEIRQVQWKPACFPAHLPQNRTVTTWHLSFDWNAPVKFIHLELLQPALQMNPNQLQAELSKRFLLPWYSSTC